MNEVEQMGSQFQTVIGRETIMYQSMVFEKDLEKNIKLLSEIVRNPRCFFCLIQGTRRVRNKKAI